MKKKKIKTKIKSTKSLEKLAKKGFQGYPIASIACYGPDDQHATKAAFGIVYNEEGDPIDMKRWYSGTIDVRRDRAINLEILEFVQENGAKSVVIADGILGCPHEEGKDYPEGSRCPKCPPKKHNVIPPFYVPDFACFQTKKWVWSYNKSPCGCFLGN